MHDKLFSTGYLCSLQCVIYIIYKYKIIFPLASVRRRMLGERVSLYRHTYTPETYSHMHKNKHNPIFV